MLRSAHSFFRGGGGEFSGALGGEIHDYELHGVDFTQFLSTVGPHRRLSRRVDASLNLLQLVLCVLREKLVPFRTQIDPRWKANFGNGKLADTFLQ